MSVVPFRKLAGFGFALALLSTPAPADALEVVASIRPVHSLVAALTDGIAEPTLLIEGGGSPHVHALRPSQARALRRADIVFWVGENLERFLVRPLEALAGDARIVTLVESDGLSLLPSREGGAREAPHRDSEDDESHAGAGDHDHHAGEFDMHIWLDPRNGVAMAASIAAALVVADPDNAPVYRANLARLEADLADLESSLRESLEAVRERPFVAFHDAYQYFERRFDLNAVGSITVSPETQPGAARLRDLRATIVTTQAQCVFSEPQFQPRLLETVLEGTGATAGVLDPLGSELPAGPRLYSALLRGMARSLIDCLGVSG